MTRLRHKDDDPFEFSVPNYLLDTFEDCGRDGDYSSSFGNCHVDSRPTGQDKYLREIEKDTKNVREMVASFDRKLSSDVEIGDDDDGDPKEVTDWLASVFLINDVQKMTFNVNTYTALLRVIGEDSFDDDGNLWGIDCEVDWEDQHNLKDYQILFTISK